MSLVHVPPIVDSSPPPPSCLSPLHALDQYLASLRSVDLEENSPKQTKQKRQDEILRVTDCLFGSCLDGALHVLEQNCSSDRCFNVTLMQSPLRTLFLVKGSANSGYRGQFRQENCYICILPVRSFNDSSRVDSAPTKKAGESTHSPEIYYCSCRSFLERSRSGASLCKHLLGLMLMPVLGLAPSVVEVGSEEEFCRAVMQRLPRA